MYEELTENPKKVSVIRGGGGIRKIRMALCGRGKSAGGRVVYFYLEVRGRIYLLTAHAKNERENLTKSEIAKLKEVSALIRKTVEK